MTDVFAYGTARFFLNCVKVNHLFSLCFVLAGLAGLYISIVVNRFVDHSSQSGGEDASALTSEADWTFTLLVIVARLGISANFFLVYILNNDEYKERDILMISIGLINFCLILYLLF